MFLPENSQAMKYSVLLICALLLCYSPSLIAQVNYQEHTITCLHEPDLTFRIDTNTVVIAVTRPENSCYHSQIFFLRNGEVISERTEYERKVREITKVGDKIYVTGASYSHGYRYVEAFFKLEYDTNGNLLGKSESFGGYTHDLTEASEAGLIYYNQGYISIDVEGSTFLHFSGSDYEEIYTMPLNFGWDINQILLVKDGLLKNFYNPEETHFLIVGLNFITTTPTSQILNSSSYNYRTLDTIVYAGLLGQQRVVTIGMDKLRIWNLDLNIIDSMEVQIPAEKYRTDGRYLLAWNTIGVTEVNGDTLTEIEIKRLDLLTLEEVLIDTIYHNLNDWDLLLNNNELQVFGVKNSTPELVVQRFNLNVENELEVIPTELAYIDQIVSDFTLNQSRPDPVMTASFEIEISNESDYIVNSLLLWNGYRTVWECDYPSLQRVTTQLLPQQVSTFSLNNIRSTGYDITNDGDSLVFYFGCYNFYPIGTPADVSLSNNRICLEIKIPETTLSNQENAAFENNVILSPNPVAEKLLVAIDFNVTSGLHYNIFDIRGNLIGRGNTIGHMNQIEIDVSNYPNGMYILNLTDPSSGGVNVTRRFVVQR